MGEREDRPAFGPLPFARTVLASIAGVLAVASLQHRLVLGVTMSGRALAAPVFVGLVFGILLALIRKARAEERRTRERLAAGEADIVRLNRALEDRVRERTVELEQKTQALLRSQRTEVLGLLAGGVAHDFNNILTAVMGCAAVLRDGLPRLPDDLRPHHAGILDELDDSAERARRLVQQLLTLGRSGTSRVETLDLADLARRITPMLRRLLGERVAVRVAATAAPAPVRADPAQLEQLVLNLAVNARDAMPAGGTFTLGVERAGPEVFLVATDGGVGMDEETRRRMFEPFFTARPGGGGTGLGLAVVQEVVRRASARVDVDSAPGRGTRICVTFPASDEPLAAAAGGPALTPAPRPRRVLLVEDDPAVRRRLVAALAEAGHTVLEAGDAREGERQLEAAGGDLDAIVCDVMLPGETGTSFAGRLALAGVTTPVVFMSGYSPEEMARAGVLASAPVLQKPFAPAALLERVARVTAGRRPG